MKKLIRHFDKQALKEEFRKLSTNLITASFVGGFVTHVADLSLTALILLLWLTIIGIILILCGIHNNGEDNG